MMGNDSALKAANQNALCSPGGNVVRASDDCGEAFKHLKSTLRFDSARPDQAPTAHRFEENEKPHTHQAQADPQVEIRHNDASDQQKSPDHAANNATLKSDISTEKTTHMLNST
jgi:hypothetical protein